MFVCEGEGAGGVLGSSTKETFENPLLRRDTSWREGVRETQPVFEKNPAVIIVKVVSCVLYYIFVCFNFLVVSTPNFPIPF